MQKNQLIKTAGLVLTFLSLVTGCTKDPITQPIEKDLITFEKEFINSLNYSSNSSIKLIGFKKIKVTPKELVDFTILAKGSRITLSNYYYDKTDGSLRVYFPVEGALVEDDAALTEANERGELQLKNSDIGKSDALFVVGRKQTELVTGVQGNVIRDGIIYLAQKNRSDHRLENTFVFDFGYKVFMEHGHSGGNDVTMEKAACMNNHGGYRNCSRAFNIYKGRCTFNANVCMDYNGWFTNCVNGKWSNFPGSDCDYAMGSGHCWNEVM